MLLDWNSVSVCRELSWGYMLNERNLHAYSWWSKTGIIRTYCIIFIFNFQHNHWAAFSGTKFNITTREQQLYRAREHTASNMQWRRRRRGVDFNEKQQKMNENFRGEGWNCINFCRPSKNMGINIYKFTEFKSIRWWIRIWLIVKHEGYFRQLFMDEPKASCTMTIWETANNSSLQHFLHHVSSTAASNQQNRFLVYLLFKLYANICSSFLTTTAPYTHSRLLAKTHHHIRSSCVLLSISPMMHIHVLCTCWWCRLLFKYTSIVERSSWRCGQLFWAVSSLSLLFPQKTHRISTPFRVVITLNL